VVSKGVSVVKEIAGVKREAARRWERKSAEGDAAYSIGR
jgi:hypothetical protein